MSQINENHTGTVDVGLNTQGIPEYIIHENVAWDYIVFKKSLQQKAEQADIFCFGSLAQRNKISRASIENVLKCCRPETLIVYDINLRQNFYSKEIIEKSLQLCNVLKLNENELTIVRELIGINGSSEELQVLEFIERYKLQLVAFTKGAEGSFLMTPSKRSYLPTPRVQVRDTVGAGDSFTAAMIIGFAEGEPLNELHQKAVNISAFVCTQDGAMPEYDNIQIFK
jgi:fructokinase